MIKAIDLWVLEQSIRGFTRLQANQGFRGIMCVNISAVELQNPDFPGHVADLLRRYRLSPDRLELEVTETSLVVNDQSSVTTLERLKELGVSLSLDDFGTGYTAFNQLMDYPVNCLKIDRSFVDRLFSGDHAKSKMVDVIQNLARLYNLRVVAEGVETEQQLAYLRQIGCDWLQGYYLSRPMEHEDFAQLLMTERNRWPMLEAQPGTGKNW
jgi:EAL domain-containing protein (putative c-di-GMP-specific phosphodiesterase class I)